MTQVKDIMTTQLVVVNPQLSLRDLIELLADEHLSGAPVVADGKVVGVVTVTDIIDFQSNLPPVPTEQTEGLAESVEDNPLSRMGYPTSVRFDPKQPTTVNYIMAVAPIPAGFDEVKSIESTVNGVTLISRNGRDVTIPLDTEFLRRS